MRAVWDSPSCTVYLQIFDAGNLHTVLYRDSKHRCFQTSLYPRLYAGGYMLLTVEKYSPGLATSVEVCKPIGKQES